MIIYKRKDKKNVQQNVHIKCKTYNHDLNFPLYINKHPKNQVIKKHRTVLAILYCGCSTIQPIGLKASLNNKFNGC